MKKLILICAVVMGQSVLVADKKPLTKEESAKAIEAAIRKKLKKPEGELTKADYEKVTVLGALSNKQLTEVPKGLEKLKQLKFLFLEGNKLTDVKGLENLTQLKVLAIENNQLTDVKGLKKLTQLTTLQLFNNQLADVKGMEKLKQLKYLNLRNNRLTSVKGLENLAKLERLFLEGNQLTDVKGLEKLKQLKYLSLASNQLTDLKGLEKLKQLKYLFLDKNPALTKAQIAELQKALPNCKIYQPRHGLGQLGFPPGAVGKQAPAPNR